MDEIPIVELVEVHRNRVIAAGQTEARQPFGAARFGHVDRQDLGVVRGDRLG
jgi:hypothetical protein